MYPIIVFQIPEPCMHQNLLRYLPNYQNESSNMVYQHKLHQFLLQQFDGYAAYIIASTPEHMEKSIHPLHCFQSRMLHDKSVRQIVPGRIQFFLIIFPLFYIKDLFLTSLLPGYKYGYHPVSL